MGFTDSFLKFFGLKPKPTEVKTSPRAATRPSSPQANTARRAENKQPKSDNTIRRVKVCEINPHGYNVILRNGDKAFMPKRCSGFAPINVGDDIEVVIIESDRYSRKVSRVEAVALRQKEIQKRVTSLLDEADAEKALTQLEECQAQADRLSVIYRNPDLQSALKNVYDHIMDNRLKCTKIADISESLKQRPVKVKVTKIKYPGLLLCEGFGTYKKCVVLPSGITLDGTPIGAMARWQILKEYIKEDSEIEVTVRSTSPDGEVAFLQYNLFIEPDEYIPPTEGEIYEVKVERNSYGFVMVETPQGNPGYIDADEFQGKIPEEGEVLRARLIDLGDNPLQFARYTIEGLNETYDPARVIIEEDNRLREIFEPEELEELRQAGIEQVNRVIKLIEEHPEIKEERHRREFPMEMCARVAFDATNYLKEAVNSATNPLDVKSLKVSFYDEKQEIYIWDSQENLFVLGRNDNGALEVQRFYEAGRSAHAHFIIQRNSHTKLLINGSRLKIIDAYSPLTPSKAADIFDSLNAILLVNKIKNDLRRDVREERLNRTALYTTASQYLNWQIEQEKRHQGEQVHIPAEAVGRRKPGKSGRLSMTFSMSQSQMSELLNPDGSSESISETDLYLEVAEKPDSRPVIAACEYLDGDTWRLDFSRDVHSLEWLKQGFYISYHPRHVT